MEIEEKYIKEALGEMLQKFGLDEDKWREHINSLPKEQRSMEFIFDTDNVKSGFAVNFNYIMTAVDITITDQKLLEELQKVEEETMK